MIPLTENTNDQDSYSHFKHYFVSSEKIPISKIVGLTTEGAPAPSKLQRRDKELAEMISDINAFIKILSCWEPN
nr:unnamed protein product [Callosobruchus chinensis]